MKEEKQDILKRAAVLTVLQFAKRDREIKKEIQIFRKECKRTEYTDTGDAWSLLDWIEEELK